MLRKFTKKRMLAVVATVAALSVAVAAFAYWSAGGSGSGSGTTASSVPNVTVKQTSATGTLAPGQSLALSGNFDNNATGAAPAYVNSVSATVGTVTKATGAPAGTCDSSDYEIDGTPATGNSAAVGAEIPVGAAQGSWSGLSLKMVDKGSTNQDACKGATVAINYTAQ